MAFNWQNAWLACTKNPVWFPGPQQTTMALFSAQGTCVVEGVEADEALRIMATAFPEPELCTLADQKGAQLLEATHLCCCFFGVTIKTIPLMLQIHPLLCWSQTDER